MVSAAKSRRRARKRGAYSDGSHTAEFRRWLVETQVWKEISNDNRFNENAITLLAFRILVYVLDKPDGWSFSYGSLAKGLEVSEKRINRSIQSLKDFGYLKIENVSFKDSETGEMVPRFLWRWKMSTYAVKNLERKQAEWAEAKAYNLRIMREGAKRSHNGAENSHNPGFSEEPLGKSAIEGNSPRKDAGVQTLATGGTHSDTDDLHIETVVETGVESKRYETLDEWMDSFVEDIYSDPFPDYHPEEFPEADACRSHPSPRICAPVKLPSDGRIVPSIPFNPKSSETTAAGAYSRASGSSETTNASRLVFPHPPVPVTPLPHRARL